MILLYRLHSISWLRRSSCHSSAQRCRVESKASHSSAVLSSNCSRWTILRWRRGCWRGTPNLDFVVVEGNIWIVADFVAGSRKSEVICTVSWCREYTRVWIHCIANVKLFLFKSDDVRQSFCEGCIVFLHVKVDAVGKAFVIDETYKLFVDAI